jgi:hypothetical protein
MMCGGSYEPMIDLQRFEIAMSFMNRANFSFDSWFWLAYSLAH